MRAQRDCAEKTSRFRPDGTVDVVQSRISDLASKNTIKRLSKLDENGFTAEEQLQHKRMNEIRREWRDDIPKR